MCVVIISEIYWILCFWTGSNPTADGLNLSHTHPRTLKIQSPDLSPAGFSEVKSYNGSGSFQMKRFIWHFLAKHIKKTSIKDSHVQDLIYTLKKKKKRVLSWVKLIFSQVTNQNPESISDTEEPPTRASHHFFTISMTSGDKNQTWRHG